MDGEHIPISVSVSSNLTKERIFHCNLNPRHLVWYFNDALAILATQSKAKLKKNFLQIETAIKSRLARNLETLNQRRSHCVGTEVEHDKSVTQFFQLHKNQLLDLQEHFERYCNKLPVFGFNGARYDMNLIKSYWLLILVNKRDIEPTVIKKIQSICLVHIW